MIRDYLIPALQGQFVGWEIAFATPPLPIATFAQRQAAVGKVMIYDDGDEATVVIERITHGRFNPYDPHLSQEQRDQIITEDVVNFLKALFYDRVLLHTD